MKWFFGGVFAFMLIRAVAIVDQASWLLLVLPTVGLPVYAFGRMFFICLNDEGRNQPQNKEQRLRKEKFEMAEGYAMVFVPLAILVGAYIYSSI